MTRARPPVRRRRSRHLRHRAGQGRGRHVVDRSRGALLGRPRYGRPGELRPARRRRQGHRDLRGDLRQHPPTPGAPTPVCRSPSGCSTPAPPARRPAWRRLDDPAAGHRGRRRPGIRGVGRGAQPDRRRHRERGLLDPLPQRRGSPDGVLDQLPEGLDRRQHGDRAGGGRRQGRAPQRGDGRRGHARLLPRQHRDGPLATTTPATASDAGGLTTVRGFTGRVARATVAVKGSRPPSSAGDEFVRLPLPREPRFAGHPGVR